MSKTGNLNQLLRNFEIVISDSLEVFSWSPGRAEENLPCTQVHILCMKSKHGNTAFVMRLKSREVCQSLIDALIKHRDHVWPDKENKNART